MIKHEIKVEYLDSQALKNIIEKVYFENGQMGKILSREHYIKIDKSDDINWTIFNGLNNVTTKITNEEVIDGTMRFIIDESQGEIRLYPISIYCVKDESDKYIFY